MFEHLGWQEAADLIVKGLENTILAHTVTYDFSRLMRAEGHKDVQELKCSQFGDAIIKNM